MHIGSFLLVIASDVGSKYMQDVADDRPEIAQRVFMNFEKSIGATGLEPST